MAEGISANGMLTAADALRAAASDDDQSEAEQLSLLPALPLGEALPAGGDHNATPRRGPGRPKGAKNRSTEAWTDYLLSRYRAPAEALLSIANRPLKRLRQDLEEAGFTVKASDGIDLLKIQMAAASAVAPYLHQKQPTAIQATEGGFMVAIGSFGAGPAQGDDGVVTLPWVEDRGDGAEGGR